MEGSRGRFDFGGLRGTLAFKPGQPLLGRGQVAFQTGQFVTHLGLLRVARSRPLIQLIFLLSQFPFHDLEPGPQGFELAGQVGQPGIGNIRPARSIDRLGSRFGHRTRFKGSRRRWRFVSRFQLGLGRKRLLGKGQVPATSKHTAP